MELTGGARSLRSMEHGFTGRSSAWIERTVRDREVASSNLVAPIFSPEGEKIEQVKGTEDPVRVPFPRRSHLRPPDQLIYCSSFDGRSGPRASPSQVPTTPLS